MTSLHALTDQAFAQEVGEPSPTHNIQVARSMSDVHAYMVDAVMRDDTGTAPEALIVMDIGDDARHAPALTRAAEELEYDLVNASFDLQSAVDAHISDPSVRERMTEHIAAIAMNAPYLAQGTKKAAAAAQTAYALMDKIRTQRDRLDAQLRQLEHAVRHQDESHPLVAEFIEQYEDGRNEDEIAAICRMLGTGDDQYAIAVQQLGHGDAMGKEEIVASIQDALSCDEAQAEALFLIGMGLPADDDVLNAASWALYNETQRRIGEGQESS